MNICVQVQSHQQLLELLICILVTNNVSVSFLQDFTRTCFLFPFRKISIKTLFGSLKETIDEIENSGSNAEVNLKL